MARVRLLKPGKPGHMEAMFFVLQFFSSQNSKGTLKKSKGNRATLTLFPCWVPIFGHDPKRLRLKNKGFQVLETTENRVPGV